MAHRDSRSRESSEAGPTTDLSGTRVLITGATSGLGLAMAQALIDAGARVAITSRTRSRAQVIAANLGPTAVGLQLDIRDEASVQAAVDQAYARLGRLDMLVNNAGIGPRTVNPRFLTSPQSFWEVSPNGFRDVIETKITGSFLVARAVVPRMLAAGGGRLRAVRALRRRSRGALPRDGR